MKATFGPCILAELRGCDFKINVDLLLFDPNETLISKNYFLCRFKFSVIETIRMPLFPKKN